MIGLAVLWLVCAAWLMPPAPVAAQSLPSASTSTVQGPPDEAPADGRGDASILREPCEDALDRIVADYRPPSAEATRTSLLRLQSQCPELAHIEHNLAFLASVQGDWSQAEAHLLAALRLDRRANQSFTQLQAIREYQAALAWRDVLDDDEPSLPAPTLNLQDASVYNGTQPHLSWPRDDAGQATAVEYDVYAWWQATEFEEQAQWARHFVDGQPIPIQPPSRPVPWEQVHRRVHFNKHEAIVVLRYEQAGEHVRHLLFMSLRGNRWRIFREWSTHA